MSAICFDCGQAVDPDSGRLNRLDDDRPCPTCSERLMAALRPLLPAWEDEEAPEGAAEVPGFDAPRGGSDAEPA